MTVSTSFWRRALHTTRSLRVEPVYDPLAFVPCPATLGWHSHPDCESCKHFRPKDPSKETGYDACLRFYGIHRDAGHTVFENANYAYRNLCQGVYYQEQKNRD